MYKKNKLPINTLSGYERLNRIDLKWQVGFSRVR